MPLLLLLVLMLSACASNPDVEDMDPESRFEDRIQTQQQDGIQVSAAVPDQASTIRLAQREAGTTSVCNG